MGHRLRISLQHLVFCFMGLVVPNAFNGLAPLRDNLAVASNLIYFTPCLKTGQPN